MNVNEQVLQSMHEMAAKFAQAGIQLELPPRSNLTLGTRYTNLDMGKMLEAEFSFDARFTNPLKMFQGGFLTAAIDEVFGPLTYMCAARPAVTVEMSTSFIRPFTEKDSGITVRAEVVSKTRSVIFLKAEVRSQDGKLIATASNHSLIVSDDNLNRNKERA